MSKINKKLEQLSIINQDIMLGKRNANCISCSNIVDKHPPQKQIRGQDGKLYFTHLQKSEARTSKDLDVGEEINTLQISPRVKKSPGDLSGTSKGRASMINDLISTEAKWKGVLNELSSQEIYRNNSHVDVYQDRNTKKKMSVRSSSAVMAKNSSINNLKKMGTAHDRSLNISISGVYQSRTLSKKKLPFSFVVQNEKRSMFKNGRG